MHKLPTDEVLNEDGFVAPRAGRILLLACGALAREILDLIKVNGWDHMDLTCLPAKLHMEPDKITPAVEAAVLKHRANYDEIFVVYADCGTGGHLQAKCDELGVKMVEGPHCYSFFEGNARFAEICEHEFTAFYLTDFMIRVFDSFIWKPMGLDRHPQLRDMYFSNYTKVVHQAQINDADLDVKAQAIADKMGLPLERRFTGYGDLTTALERL